jgi:hypothetical protein
MKPKLRIIGAGHIGRLEKQFDEAPTQKFCEYSKECRKSCSEDRNCQIYKFLSRYGNDYRSFGVGGRI